MTGTEATSRSVRATAKINLFLRVLGARDDGYHDLQTLIVPVSLADRLEVHADAGPSFRTLSLSLDVIGEPDVVAGVPRDEANLVLRAAIALSEATGVRGFADLTLEKRVPSAAGLGGGSSDAAATLLVLNDLWRTGLDQDQLRELGATVGSDVPALMAGGPVLAEGRGERVRSVPCRSLRLVVVTFALEVSTPEAFGWWDQEGSTGPDPDELLRWAALGSAEESLGRLLFNDLEEPVSSRHPTIAQAKRILLGGGVAGAAMSGSGPSVFGILLDGRERLDREVEDAITEVSGRAPVYLSSLGSFEDEGAGPP